MNDEIWSRDEIESPCINICLIHPDAGICTGCFRTIDEIRDWQKFSPAERRQIMDDLNARALQLKKRRGGRAARLKR